MGLSSKFWLASFAKKLLAFHAQLGMKQNEPFVSYPV